jgi:hypothetical protein
VRWWLADLLLSTYVELHGNQLSLLVQQSMASKDWLSLPTPSAPQPLCEQLLQSLSQAEAEVVRLLDSSGRQQGRFPRTSHGIAHKSGGHAPLVAYRQRVVAYCPL